MGRGKYFGKQARTAWNKAGKFAKKKRVANLLYNIALAQSGAGQYQGTGMYTGGGSYKRPKRTRPMYSHAKANHLLGGGAGSQPKFSSKTDETGALTITHSEYVRDIYGQGNVFHNQSLPLNVGLSKTFPWLGSIAANYEEFELKQLVFGFQSVISDQLGSSNGQVGEILMFTDYGADSAMKTSKQQMLQAYGSCSAVVTQDLNHFIECDPKKLHGDGHKYVRTSPLAGGRNINDYDLGLFQLAVSGTPSALEDQIIGQLYVSYTVVLRKPRLYVGIGLAIDRDEFYVDKGLDQYNLMNSGVGFLTVATNNSIGSRIDATVLGTQSAQQEWVLTLPASFSGGLEVCIQSERAGTPQGNSPATRFITVNPASALAGNIVVNTNMGSCTQELPTDTLGAGFMTSLQNGIHGGMARFRFHVEQASSGTDNAIKFLSPLETAAAGSVKPWNSTFVTVTRYNDFETDGLSTFVNQQAV